MIVLLDIEWIEKGKKFLTQISAVRVDENWNNIDSINVLAKPDSDCFQHFWHVAFGGYGMEQFKSAPSSKKAFTGFADWLESDDEIWVWAESNKQILEELWKLYLPGQELPVTKISAGKARGLAAKKGFPGQSPYNILIESGVKTPRPEHRASNDTEAMRQVFAFLEMSQESLKMQGTTIPQTKHAISKKQQRRINRDMIARTHYNFIYLKNSSVFHRRTCKLWQAAKNETEIFGAVYYDTAAKDRCPCKICKPVPIIENGIAQTRKRKKPGPDALSRTVVKVKLITGETIPIRPTKVIGWCRNSVHKGALNKALFEEHNCLGKNCNFLERNSQCPFWDELQAKQKQKEKTKRLVKEKKEAAGSGRQ